MSSQQAPQLPTLYLITDRTIATPNLLCALESALKGGVRMVQLREKNLSPSELKKIAQKALVQTRIHDAKLLLNGSPELAADIGADGVHLGIHSCQIPAARSILGERSLIGYSAHSTQDAESAADQGADFITFSPIYHTASKSQYGQPQGLQALANICKRSPIPVYALGGITSTRVSEVLNAGAYGVALISAILAATDVQNSAQHLRQKISNFKAS